MESYHRHQHRQMPEDVVMEILTRLPVKSLLRFKCVCRNWYDLIQNPNFAHMHILSQKRRDKGRLLLEHPNRDPEHQHTDLYGYALFPDETLASGGVYHDLDIIPCYSRLTCMEGPVNGLFCLSDQREHIVLWNPAIREFRKLPFPQQNPNVRPDFFVFYSSIGFGLGLDPLTDHYYYDDYKVVLIRALMNGNPDQDDEYDAMVYSLRSNTWRYVDVTKSLLLSGSSDGTFDNGTYLDGVYYWSSRGHAVVAFDMGKEVFRVIPGPDIHSRDYCYLALYRDCQIAACLIKDMPEGRETGQLVEVWVMEAEGSWTKLFQVARPPPPEIPWPRGIWKNGELLFVTTSGSLDIFGDPISQLAMYNPITQEIRRLGPEGLDDHRFKARVYYESLVSVGGGMYRRKGKVSDYIAAPYFYIRRNHFKFMPHLVLFMSEFRGIKEENIEPVFTDLDHIKVRRMLSRLWDSCEYSVHLPMI